MPSIVIPAFNEEQSLAGTLDALLQGLDPEVQVIVVCNGCTDRTPQIAGEFEPRIEVIELKEAGKTGALNAGDRRARMFPRVYLDADVRVSGTQISRVISALEQPEVYAVEASPEFDCSQSSLSVRSFYRVWTALHSKSPGTIGSGLFALSQQGRSRFNLFPDVISDDGYARLHFSSGELRRLENVKTAVSAPKRLQDLIRIKSRSRLGTYQLQHSYPDLWRARLDASTSVAARALSISLRLWPHVPVYLYVNAVARLRARRQFRDMSLYKWERDHSTR